MCEPMKRRWKLGVLVASLLAGQAPGTAAGGTPAEVQAVLDANGCSSCHAPAEQVVGPAFQDIARRYAGTPGAVDALAAKVRAGGAGVWGQVAMPANTQIADGDLRRVLDWILRRAP